MFVTTLIKPEMVVLECLYKVCLFCLIAAIDPEGLLCQARDPSGWHGTRSNKAVAGKGARFYFSFIVNLELLY